jgi:ABC-type transporter Mla MlaB component
MLKISAEDEPHQVTLKLEGSLAGTWVVELEDFWRAVRPRLSGRPLCLHLTGVKHVDNAGRYLLALLCYSGVHLAADGIVMTELVRTLAEEWPVDREQTSGGRNRASRKMPSPLM